ncbi:MAG: hypothetical protein IT423_22760 [Pirellulaceae bacterium]|nr:hypothetical protein [Pirellulaceae bacterium]
MMVQFLSLVRSKRLKTQHGRAVVLITLSPLFVSVLFALLLGYRPDYLGHFTAGYGGTLSAHALAIAILQTQFHRYASAMALVGTVACIGMGTILEATVFSLAKFDEVDYCNQNLGAILAGLVVIRLSQFADTTDALLGKVMACAAAFLIAGVYFAAT